MIDFIIIFIGYTFGALTVRASTHAKENDTQHSNQLSLYVHLASTISMYALYAWGILELDWNLFRVAWLNSAVVSWLGPLAIFGFLFQLLRFVVTSSNWEKFFGAISITGGITTFIACGVWIKWIFER